MTPDQKTIEPLVITSDGIAVWCHYDELVDPATLPEYPGNPNHHPDSQLGLLGEVIATNGWRQPITRSRQSGYVTKGAGRKAAALAKGWSQVPVAWQDYPSEEAERADVIADNRIAELSEIDPVELAQIIESLNPSAIGFSAAEIERLQSKPKITALAVQPPPKMVWVLIGFPTVRFSEINQQVETLAKIKGIFLESTANDGD